MDEKEKLNRLIQRERIGELLLGAKKITLNQLIEAIEEQERRRATIGHILLEKGYVTLQQLEETLEQQQQIKEVVGEALKELGLDHLVNKSNQG